MTQATNPKNWISEMDHLSGIATVSTKLKDGLGALHLRLQVNSEEIRFMFSAIDFSRLVSGKMIRGYDRDDFNERAYPITAKKLGNYAVFEVYGTHCFYCLFEDLTDLWSFNTPSLFISGSAPMTRTETLIQIGCRAMDRVFPADIHPCRKIVGA